MKISFGSVKAQYLLLEFEIEQMSRFLNLINDSLDAHLQEFVSWADGEAQELPEDIRNDFFEYHADEYAALKEDFPRRFFSSFVVSWYSLVESELFRICDRLNLQSTNTVHQRDRFGRGITRASKFLAAVAKYEIDKDHWNELVRIREVRNLIVHTRGRIPYKLEPEEGFESEITLAGNSFYLQLRNDSISYLNKHALPTYSGAIIIAPTYEYCRHLIGFFKAMFSKLYSDLKP